MTDNLRVLVESAVFWEDLKQQWLARGNQDAVAKCEKHAADRWAMVDRLLNQRERRINDESV